MYSMFIASPKGTSIQESQYIAKQIQESKGEPIKAFHAQEEFQKHFASCGGWQGWSDFVATSSDFVTRQPRYTEIICTTKEVGRATADIVRKALSYNKPVYLWRMQRLHRVDVIETTDSENWQRGWTLITSE